MSTPTSMMFDARQMSTQLWRSAQRRTCELLDRLRDLVAAPTGRQLHGVARPARRDAVAALQPDQVVGDVGLEQRHGVAELAQAVEEVQVRPVAVAVSHSGICGPACSVAAATRT